MARSWVRSNSPPGPRVIDLGVGVSFFGSSLGIMAGTTRTLYTLARDAVLPRAFARVHRTRRTPTTAVAVLAVIYLVLSMGGVLVTSAEHSYGLLGTLAGYLLVAAYGIATVVAGAYAVRTRSLGVGVVTAVLLGVAGVTRPPPPVPAVRLRPGRTEPAVRIARGTSARSRPLCCLCERCGVGIGAGSEWDSVASRRWAGLCALIGLS
ncbi:amino acid permease [Pseudonocardia sp. Cha107L01]|uniref:amino acid permease n=1 Tax=Pseudonocardia sp. Cha107L01 TaxID=3457576 RepID=UPI00403E7F3C